MSARERRGDRHEGQPAPDRGHRKAGSRHFDRDQRRFADRALFDQASIQQIRNSLQGVEVGEKRPFEDFVDAAPPVDPLPRLRLSLRDRHGSVFGAVARDEAQSEGVGRATKDDVVRGELLLGRRELVERPCRLEEDRLRRQWREEFGVLLHHCLRGELEAALRPTESREDDAVNLDAERFAEVVGLHELQAEQKPSQPLGPFLLLLERPQQSLLGEQARLDEKGSQPVLEGTQDGVGRDHAAVEEPDRDGVLRSLHGQHSALPLHSEHLKDLGDREDAEVSVKAHGSASTR